MNSTLDQPTTHDPDTAAVRPVHLWPSRQRGVAGAVAACGATEFDHQDCPATNVLNLPADKRCVNCGRPVCELCLAEYARLTGR